MLSRDDSRINENYSKLQAGYLFPEIARRVGEFSAANPDAKIIRLGIGDVTLPLAPAIVEALQRCRGRDGPRNRRARIRPGKRLRLPDRSDLRARLQGERCRHRRRRGVRLGRQQTGQRKHPGDLRHRMQDCGHRPLVSRLRRHQRDGRTHRRRKPRRHLRRYPLSPSDGSKRLRAAAPRGASRSRLSLFTQQPHRLGGFPREPGGLGSAGRNKTTPS